MKQSECDLLIPAQKTMKRRRSTSSANGLSSIPLIKFEKVEQFCSCTPSITHRYDCAIFGTRAYEFLEVPREGADRDSKKTTFDFFVLL